MAAYFGAETFPEDCILQHVDEELAQELNPEVKKALSEDVTYRLKEIIHNAVQFMKHSNRLVLTADDVSRSLKWSDIDPVLGLPSSQSSTEESDNFGLAEQDRQVPLENMAATVPPSKRPTLQGSWLCLEGDVLDPSSMSVNYERNPIEAEETYLHSLTDAIQGDNEDIRRTAFVDIRSNGAVTSILPELVQFVLNSVESRYHITALQLHRTLRTLLAISGNPNLYLEPYVPTVVESMFVMCLDRTTYKSQDRTTDWMVRDLSALCLAESLKHMVGSYSKLRGSIHRRIEEQLQLPTIDYGPTYGAVLIACYLGKQAVLGAVWPNLSKLQNEVDSHLHLHDCLESTRTNAAKLNEALLSGVQMLLTDEAGTDTDSHPVQRQDQQESDTDMDTQSLHSNTQSTKTATSEMRETLYEMYGEVLMGRMLSAAMSLSASRQNQAAVRAKHDETIDKTSEDTKPSGSVSEDGRKVGIGTVFRSSAQRVDMQYCKQDSAKPIVYFTCKNSATKVYPWNILDPDTYEMYVKQQRVFRQHLQKQHGEQQVAKGKLKKNCDETANMGTGKTQTDRLQLNNTWL